MKREQMLPDVDESFSIDAVYLECGISYEWLGCDSVYFVISTGKYTWEWLFTEMLVDRPVLFPQINLVSS